MEIALRQPTIRHELGIGSLIKVILSGIGATLVLGFLYAYATTYIPIVYTNVLLAIVYGCGIGSVAISAADLGIVKNRRLVISVALCLGIIGCYTMWVFWLFAVGGLYGEASFFWAPTDVWERFQTIAAEGTWLIGSGGFAVEGGSLIAIWCLEAAIVVGAAILTARYVADVVLLQRLAERDQPKTFT